MQILNHLPITIDYEDSEGGRVIVKQETGCGDPQEIHIPMSQLDAVVNVLVDIIEGKTA